MYIYLAGIVLGAWLLWKSKLGAQGPSVFRQARAGQHKASSSSKKPTFSWTDRILLHKMPPSRFAPSISQFCIKLETFLRMSGFKYDVDTESMFAPSTGKSPWIEWNDNEFADSQFITDILHASPRHTFHSDKDPATAAINHAVRLMLEDHFYWIVLCLQFVHTDEPYRLSPAMKKNFLLDAFLEWYIPRTLRQQCWATGIGRHDKKQVRAMGVKVLQSLAVILGEDEEYFSKTSEPSATDACVFAFLIFPSTSFFERELEEKCENLVRYRERMKKRFWPDWSEHIQG